MTDLISGGVHYGLAQLGLNGTPTFEQIIAAMPEKSIAILEPSETSNFIMAHTWGLTIIFKINISRNIFLHYTASNENSIIKLGRYSPSANEGRKIFVTEITGNNLYN